MTSTCYGQPCIVWHGGIGHKMLSTDDGSECYRCGMHLDSSVDDDHGLQSIVPDCVGPSGHYWTATTRDSIACEWCGIITDGTEAPGTITECIGTVA